MKYLWAACLLTGCSYSWDANAPVFPLTGSDPHTELLPKLNMSTAVARFNRFTAPDGRPWISLFQANNSFYMVPLLPPRDSSDQVNVSSYDFADFRNGNEIFLVDKSDPKMGDPLRMTTLSIRRAGSSRILESYTVPGKSASSVRLSIDTFQGGFVYTVFDSRLPGYLIQRRDRKFQRIVPWPKGFDPDNWASVDYKGGRVGFIGNWLFERDGDQRLIGHHLTDNRDLDLGVRPGALYFYQAQLFTCGADGLRVLGSDGKSMEKILDQDACYASPFQLINKMIYYRAGSTIRRQPIDGSAPPESFYELGTKRFIGFTETQDVIYSTDPEGRYVNDAGDGWIGDWNFMERGFLDTIDYAQKRLYYLEHAAQTSGAGLLKASTMPSAPGGVQSMTFGINVRGFAEMSDKRLLAIENYASESAFTRLVLINEAAKTKRWIATGIVDYDYDEGLGIIIGKRFFSDAGGDIVIIPIPPTETPAPTDAGM